MLFFLSVSRRPHLGDNPVGNRVGKVASRWTSGDRHTSKITKGWNLSDERKSIWIFWACVRRLTLASGGQPPASVRWWTHPW